MTYSVIREYQAIWLALIASGVGAVSARHQDAGKGALSADEIVSRANRVAYYQGKDGSAHVKMTIRDSRGRTRIRELVILRWDVPPEKNGKRRDADEYCGDQKFYVYFLKPADVSKMSYLVWKHLDKDDDRWIYMPALDVVKRLASSEERTSFAGSDFLYEDVSGRNISDDKHELIETTGERYVIKSSPKNPDTVEFSYYKTWIDKTTFIMVKSEFFDKNGGKYREYKSEGITKIQDYHTATKLIAKDLKRGNETTVELSNIKYDIGLEEQIFSERYLRNPPTKYLKD